MSHATDITSWNQLQTLVDNFTMKELYDYCGDFLKRVLWVEKERAGHTTHCCYPIDKNGKLLQPNPDGYTRAVLAQASGAQRKSGISNKQLGAYSHHLMWFFAGDFNRALLLPIVDPTTGVVHPTHISHLCHDPRCCNPEHLHREPAWINILRKTCVARQPADCQCNQALSPYFRNKTPPCVFRTPTVTDVQRLILAPLEKPKKATPKKAAPPAKD